MDELWDKTRARNAAIEKGWRDRRQEEQRLRDCAYASGGYPTGGNHGKRKGSGVLFWLAALAFVGAKLLHLF